MLKLFKIFLIVVLLSLPLGLSVTAKTKQEDTRPVILTTMRLKDTREYRYKIVNIETMREPIDWMLESARQIVFEDARILKRRLESAQNEIAHFRKTLSKSLEKTYWSGKKAIGNILITLLSDFKQVDEKVDNLRQSGNSILSAHFNMVHESARQIQTIDTLIEAYNNDLRRWDYNLVLLKEKDANRYQEVLKQKEDWKRLHANTMQSLRSIRGHLIVLKDNLIGMIRNIDPFIKNLSQSEFSIPSAVLGAYQLTFSQITNMQMCDCFYEISASLIFLDSLNEQLKIQMDLLNDAIPAFYREIEKIMKIYQDNYLPSAGETTSTWMEIVSMTGDFQENWNEMATELALWSIDFWKDILEDLDEIILTEDLQYYLYDNYSRRVDLSQSSVFQKGTKVLRVGEKTIDGKTYILIRHKATRQEGYSLQTYAMKVLTKSAKP